MVTEAYDYLTVLRGDPKKRAAKRFKADGTQDSYNAGLWFSATSVPIYEIDDLAETLSQLTARPDCHVIRGAPLYPPDTPVKRRKKDPAYFKEIPRRWMILDIDDPIPPEVYDPTDRLAVEWAVHKFLPAELQDVSFVIQFSGSAGFSRKIKAHLWFLLDEPVGGGALEDTIQAWNQAYFGDQWMGRNGKTKVVDFASARTVQPCYTSAPVLESGIADPFADRPRVEIVRRARDTASLKLREPDETARRPSGGSTGSGANGTPAPVTNGREEFVRDTIWAICQEGPLRSADEAADRVIARLNELNFVWGRPEGSDNFIDYQWVRQKTVRDNEVQRAVQRSTITLPPPTEYDPDTARNSLRHTLGRFVRNGGRTAIRGAAGLGKSTMLAERLSKDLPAGSYVEVYVPTSAEVETVTDRLQSYGLDARAIHGRQPGLCDDDMYPMVKLAGEQGHPVERTVCERCDLFKVCNYYTQDPDFGPAIRVMAHAKLRQERSKELPAPHYLVVDETLIPEVKGELTLSKDDFTDFVPNLRKFRNAMYDLFRAAGDDQAGSPDPEGLTKLTDFLLDALKNIQHGEWFFHGYDIANLKELHDVAASFKEDELINPKYELSEAVKKLQRSLLKHHKRVIQTLKFAYEDLEKFGEPRRFRQDAEPQSDDALLRILWRKELAKFKGTHNILLLDADLEPDIVNRYGAGEFDIVEINARRDCTVIAINDHNLSRSKVLDKKGKLTRIGREAWDFADRHADGVISYKGVREATVGAPKKQRTSHTDSGTVIGHFGYLRSCNTFENCNSLAVVGRECTGDAAADAARALYWDDPDPVGVDQHEVYFRRVAGDGSELTRQGRRWADPRVRRVESATDSAETRQAIDRGRWIGSEGGVVYLLTADAIPEVRVDHFTSWGDLKATGDVVAMLDWYDGALPLSAACLVAHGWFGTEKAAKRWIANNEPQTRVKGPLYGFGAHSPILTGTYRQRGQKGRTPTRFIARGDAADIGTRLEAATGASLAWYQLDDLQPQEDTTPMPVTPEPDTEAAPPYATADAVPDTPEPTETDPRVPSDAQDAAHRLGRIFGTNKVSAFTFSSRQESVG